MKTKIVATMIVTLGVYSWAHASEYKTPEVGLKTVTPTETVAKSAEFSDDYKVEGAVKADRQIASEEDSDREPSSVVAEDEKEEKHLMKKYLQNLGTTISHWVNLNMIKNGIKSVNY